MRLSAVDLYLWAAGFCMQGLLLATLAVRRQMRRLPFFTAMVAFATLQTPVLYLVHRTGNAGRYFWTYWIAVSLGQILEFCVLYEIASRVFRPLGRWVTDVRQSPALIVLTSLAIAAIVTWMAAPPTYGWRQETVMRASLFCSAMMGELIIAMVVLSVTSGLTWQTYISRIALGLGLYSLAEILIYGIEDVVGTRGSSDLVGTLSQVRIALYLLCLLYWTAALWWPVPTGELLPRDQWRQINLLRTQLSRSPASSGSGSSGERRP